MLLLTLIILNFNSGAGDTTIIESGNLGPGALIAERDIRFDQRDTQGGRGLAVEFTLPEVAPEAETLGASLRSKSPGKTELDETEKRVEADLARICDHEPLGAKPMRCSYLDSLRRKKNPVVSSVVPQAEPKKIFPAACRVTLDSPFGSVRIPAGTSLLLRESAATIQPNGSATLKLSSALAVRDRMSSSNRQSNGQISYQTSNRFRLMNIVCTGTISLSALDAGLKGIGFRIVLGEDQLLKESETIH